MNFCVWATPRAAQSSRLALCSGITQGTQGAYLGCWQVPYPLSCLWFPFHVCPSVVLNTQPFRFSPDSSQLFTMGLWGCFYSDPGWETLRVCVLPVLG